VALHAQLGEAKSQVHGLRRRLLQQKK
jgi:hypothetical protein